MKHTRRNSGNSSDPRPRLVGTGAVAAIPLAVFSLAVFSLVIFSVAGCATNKAASGTGGFTGANTGTSAGASAGATPSVTPLSPPTTGGTSTPAVPRPSASVSPAPITYPASAQAYTTDAVKAWANHDAVRLAAYVNAGGAVEFKNLPHLSGPWHFHNCFADGDNTACTFDSPVGDRLTVDVIPADMNQPHGVTSAFVDKTAYPSDATGLVGAFVTAWQTGNAARESQLANTTTTTKVNTLMAPGSTMMPSPPDTTTTFGHTLVTIDALIGVAHYLITFDVDNGKLGHSHAMTLVSIVP